MFVKWLGHASFQIKAKGKVVYVDLKKTGKMVETTEKADIVLVTHNHSDHCSPLKIKRLSKKDTFIVCPADCLPRIGGKNVRSLKPGEEATFEDVKIRAVEAYNTKRMKPSGKPWHPKGYGVGYVIEIEGKTVYHAGDTDLIPEMRELKGIDFAMLPTGDKYTMDDVDAAEAVVTFKPRFVCAMHTWGKGSEKFRKKVAECSKVKAVVLMEGEEFELK